MISTGDIFAQFAYFLAAVIAPLRIAMENSEPNTTAPLSLIS